MAAGTETRHDEAQARAALASVASALRGDLPPLAARVDAAVLAAVPALAADPDIELALERSTESTSPTSALLAEPALPVDAGVPPEALALATTLVRRGVGLSLCSHALVAQNELWRAWMEEMTERLPPAPPLLIALELARSHLHARDFLVAQLMRHIDRERVRWMGGALARRTELVRELLAGEEREVGQASRALGYELDRHVWPPCCGTRQRRRPRCRPRRARGTGRLHRAGDRGGPRAHDRPGGVPLGLGLGAGRAGPRARRAGARRHVARRPGRRSARRPPASTASDRPSGGDPGAPDRRVGRPHRRRPLRPGRVDRAAQRRPRSARAPSCTDTRRARRRRPCHGPLARDFGSRGSPRAATPGVRGTAPALKSTVLYRLQRAQQSSSARSTSAGVSSSWRSARSSSSARACGAPPRNAAFVRPLQSTRRISSACQSTLLTPPA